MTETTEVWRRPLRELLADLTARLDAGESRPRVKLAHGAYLGLSRRPNGQRVLRIARAVAPRDETGRKRWRLELDVFRKQLGLEAWAQASQAPITGVAAAFVEPAQESLAL